MFQNNIKSLKDNEILHIKMYNICGYQLEFWGNLLDTKWKLEKKWLKCFPMKVEKQQQIKHKENRKKEVIAIKTEINVKIPTG